MKNSHRWSALPWVLLTLCITAHQARAASALPQFLGANSITPTPVVVTDEQLEVHCTGGPPTLHCASSSIITLQNPTAAAVEVQFEVDIAANAWSVDGKSMAVKGDPTGDGLLLLADAAVIGPQQSISVRVSYAPATFDGSPDAASLIIPGLELSAPITFRHPLVARPYAPAVAVELCATGVRSDRYARVSKHTADITVPSQWEIHSKTGTLETNDKGEHVIHASSATSPPASDPHFKTQAVLNAPPKWFPLGPFAAVGYRWVDDCPSCKSTVLVRGGFDLALGYLWSLGLAGEYSDSKHAVAALTLDFSLPLYVLSGYAPLVVVGAGAPIRIHGDPDLGVRAELAASYKLGFINLGGAFITDVYPHSSHGNWSVAPMALIGL